jgi:hypothetical protein
MPREYKVRHLDTKYVFDSNGIIKWADVNPLEYSKANYLLSIVRRACNILFAFSNSRLREADKPLPARFMKYCIIRIPEPNPLGLTFFEPICRAIVSASLVNIPFLGNVDSVVTFLTHRFLVLRDFLDGIWISGKE